MRVIHEMIAWEIIILKIQPVTKSYLLLWRYPVKLISVFTGQQNRSADRTVKNYRLAMFNVRYKTGVDLCLLLFPVSF